MNNQISDCMTFFFINILVHGKGRAEGSHRARWDRPLQFDFSVDVGGVAGEGETLVTDENDSLGRLHYNHRRSDGHCKDVQIADMVDCI